MLWAALLVTNLGRVRGLQRFREVADHIFRLPDEEKYWQVSHTAIAGLQPQQAKDLVSVICRGERFAAALSPLLLFDQLPARELWEAQLSSVKVIQSWDELGQAILACYDHQSQEATDCRWLKMLTRLVGGQLFLPPGDMVRELVEYPSYGDQTRVRPTIRASEISFATDDSPSAWSRIFWQECFDKTYCHGLEQLQLEEQGAEARNIELRTEREEALKRAKHLSDVWGLLGAQCIGTARTTAVDARHDAVFGTALYALAILHEISTQLLGRRVLGRVGMRVIAECYVTLAYLLVKDEPELWLSYRVHGAGQAKLAFLKFADSEKAPASIDLKVLEHLANEDAWQEFLPINLGHWDNANLRDMSVTAEVKDVYDKYYPWPSSYVHGQWGAVRDTVLDTCVNALHRFHRIPRFSPRKLPDTISDAITLTNKVLELVSSAYPEFTARVSDG